MTKTSWVDDLDIRDDWGRYAMPAFRLCAYFPLTTHPYHYTVQYERLFAHYRPILEENTRIIRIFETPGTNARRKIRIQPGDWTPFQQICKDKEPDIEAAYWFGFEFFDQEDKRRKGVGPNRFYFFVWHDRIALDACISVEAWRAGQLNIDQLLGALADLPCWTALGGYGAALADSCDNGGYSPVKEDVGVPARRYEVLDLCHVDLRKGVVVSDDPGDCGIAGINWITLVGEPYLSRVGGFSVLRKALPGAVEMTDLGWGAVLRLGPEPIAGDKETNEHTFLYHAVGKVLRPVGYPVPWAEGEMVFGDEQTSIIWQRRFYDPADAHVKKRRLP
ncbi:type VI immunity family protein [Candidatus Thiosymbion oneisti]|uniref:type VI immunity family protein n=1 Tax=Candidatus Thiosymbion oneisti TaxID=589554 RepID=UPI000B7DA570|nr:type VI immunity family protein [Candidatus Thiosymbion oneisti]